MINPLNSQLFSNLRTSHFYSYLMYLNNRRKNDFGYYQKLKELQKIMKHNNLDTFFQPILKLKSGETIGYEVLNRPTATNIFTDTESFYQFVGQSNQVFLFECFCRNISLKRFIERYKANIEERPPFIFINIHPHVLFDSNYHSGETGRV
jgi:EAL domain-containing protein (putative c-di-GMP-specific phosphodiesterase class I)